MNFGLSLTCARLGDDTLTLAQEYEAVVDAAQLADELGFATVVVTEHHFLENGWCPAPLTVATSIAARTSQIRIGTGILILPLFHPVRLAEEVAVLDNLSGGRVVLGLGIGYRREEFDGYGVDYDTRLARWREGLSVLPELLRGDAVTFAGEHYQLRGASIRPKPIQQPVPIWIGTTGERGIRRAAREGLSVFLGNAAPSAMLGRRIGWYLDERQRHGVTSPYEIPLMREMFVAPTREEAYEHVREAIENAYKEHLIGLGWSVPVVDEEGNEDKTSDREHPALAFETLVQERCVVGSPADCIEQIAAYQDIGATSLLFRVHHPGLPHGAVSKSMRLFADEVMPAFRESS